MFLVNCATVTNRGAPNLLLASPAKQGPARHCLPPLRSWVRSLYRASDCTWEEFVNTVPKVVGFLRVLWFPPTGKVDWVG